MKRKLAKYISIIGHPFITISVFVIIVLFTSEEFNKALLISFLIVGCIIFPVAMWNYLKTKNGEYTNFDVSVRTQRYSMYLFMAVPLLTITVVLFYTNQPKGICYRVLFGLVLLLISFIVNLYIKCSGHVSLTIYLSFLVIPLNVIIGIIILLLSGLIGWSRVELKKHTVKEVFTGAVIGFTVGFLMLITEVII